MHEVTKPWHHCHTQCLTAQTLHSQTMLSQKNKSQKFTSSNKTDHKGHPLFHKTCMKSQNHGSIDTLNDLKLKLYIHRQCLVRKIRVRSSRRVTKRIIRVTHYFTKHA